MQRDEIVGGDERTGTAAEDRTAPVGASLPPPAQPSGLTAAPASTPHVRWQLVAVVACLAITAALWLDTRRQLSDIRAGQRQLTADVAELRRMPVIDVTGAPALGPDAAVVTLIEFSDYECPYCIKHFAATMPQIARELVDAGRIRYVFRDFPIAELHPGSPRAHEAARCANDQGRFWQMHTRLFSAPGTHSDPALSTLASAAGLDLTQFQACLESGRHSSDVKASVAQVMELGGSGTPLFLVGVRDRTTNHVEVVRVISGAQPFSAFKEAVDAVSARVNAS